MGVCKYPHPHVRAQADRPRQARVATSWREYVSIRTCKRKNGDISLAGISYDLINHTRLLMVYLPPATD